MYVHRKWAILAGKTNKLLSIVNENVHDKVFVYVIVRWQDEYKYRLLIDFEVRAHAKYDVYKYC